jgi:hypothetical protein
MKYHGLLDLLIKESVSGRGVSTSGLAGDEALQKIQLDNLLGIHQ